MYILDRNITDLSNSEDLYGTNGDPFSKSLADNSPDNNYLFQARKEAADQTDIGKMIDSISIHSQNNTYLIPPEFDFVHNKDIPPFQMMIIPFTDTLDKQDLIDIYQGIMPQSSKNIVKDKNFFSANPGFVPSFSNLYIPEFTDALRDAGITNFLSPKLFLDDIFSSLQYPLVNEDEVPVLISDHDSVNPSVRPYKTSREFYRNLKFMVFKVKQRSKKDYANYKTQQMYSAAQAKIDGGTISGENIVFVDNEERRKIMFKTAADVYGSNWPYDYFSLIESGKIDVEIKVAG